MAHRHAPLDEHYDLAYSARDTRSGPRHSDRKQQPTLPAAPAIDLGRPLRNQPIDDLGGDVPLPTALCCRRADDLLEVGHLCDQARRAQHRKKQRACEDARRCEWRGAIWCRRGAGDGEGRDGRRSRRRERRWQRRLGEVCDVFAVRQGASVSGRKLALSRSTYIVSAVPRVCSGVGLPSPCRRTSPRVDHILVCKRLYQHAIGPGHQLAHHRGSHVRADLDPFDDLALVRARRRAEWCFHGLGSQCRVGVHHRLVSSWR